MKIILHIGTEKTGTTSIQQFLLTNRSLLTKNNVLPASELFLKNVSNNFELVLASNPNPGNLIRFRGSEFPVFRQSIKSRIARLIATAAKAGKEAVVFSSEHMSSRLVELSHVEALNRLFPRGHDIEIIVYVRRQDELYLGAQAEAIKRGYQNLKFADPFLRSDNGTYGRKYYDYDLMLDAWAQVFGRRNITVRPYERSQLRGRDIVEDFYSLISANWSFSKYKKTPRTNRRLSAQALFIISKLNKEGKESPEWIEERISKLDDFDPSVLVPGDVLHAFFDRFEASNRSLSAKYLNNRELFTETRKAYSYFDQEDEEQVLKAIERFA